MLRNLVSEGAEENSLAQYEADVERDREDVERSDCLLREIAEAKERLGLPKGD